MIRNRYNQVPHLSQGPNGKVEKITINITNKRQEASPFPSVDPKAAMNRRESMKTQNINNTKDPQKKYRLRRVSQNILLKGFNQLYGANLAFNSNVDQDTFGKVTKHKKTQLNTHDSQKVIPFSAGDHKASRNRHDSKNTPT